MPGENPDGQVTVYTRPGCPFCTLLRAGLRRHDLTFVEVDIWQDPDAAAVVRSLADGNETVPTVVIGPPGRDSSTTGTRATDTGVWAAVNPSPDAVVKAAATHAPASLPAHRPGLVEGALSALRIRRAAKHQDP